jgi:NAD(P)-dependent dehydrogenase (short-subunit alcohol dehydrogenase family)
MSRLHPLFQLEGCSALVTGAGSSSGIGFATARLLGARATAFLTMLRQSLAPAPWRRRTAR